MLNSPNETLTGYLLGEIVIKLKDMNWVISNIVKPVCRQDTFRASGINAFKCTIGKGEKQEHIMAKFKLWLKHRMKGDTVFTELRFKNGSRADLLVIDASNFEVTIHEVLCSEKVKLNKATIYPFRIMMHKAKELLREEHGNSEN